jgi:deoxyhypusine synthase
MAIENRNREEFGTGFNHGFKPLESIDINKIDDADGMLKAMSKTAFGGRTLGDAADVVYNMVTDPDCFSVLTLSGAMTVAKMGLLATEMIDRGMIHAVISTGALMTHGLVENAGMTHFKYDFSRTDLELSKLGYDRVYDTLELESNLDDLEEIVFPIFEKLDPKKTYCSREIIEKIGEYLHTQIKGRGIVQSAYANHVPIYIPALTDSELGLDLALFNRIQKKENKPTLEYNPFNDLNHFTELILKQKTLGIFTIGGGVPRNWAQQIGPFLDLIRWRILDNASKDAYYVKPDNPYYKAYKYATRICPEPVQWGGLSGCTYSEGVSWGKFFDPKKEGGQFAEVMSDATLVWPLLLKAVLERLKKNNITIKKNFDNEKVLRSVAI